MDTFEELDKCSRAHLEAKLKAAQDDLASAQRERWTLIGKIMFYQHAAEAERAR